MKIVFAYIFAIAFLGLVGFLCWLWNGTRYGLTNRILADILKNRLWESKVKPCANAHRKGLAVSRGRSIDFNKVNFVVITFEKMLDILRSGQTFGAKVNSSNQVFSFVERQFEIAG